MMWDLALQVGLANLAIALIPGHSLALISAGIAASGVSGGMRVMAGVTVAKLVWASAALGLLPLAVAAGPVILDTVRIAGGLALALIGMARLVNGARAGAASRSAQGTIRGGFAASLVSPTTSIFCLSAFPALAAPLPSAGADATALLLVAVMLSNLVALLPWFALGLAARRLGPRTLRIASGGFMVVAGVALAVSAF